MIPIMTEDNGERYKVTPLRKADAFPAFTEIEIDDKGDATGWVITGQPKDSQMYHLGSPGKGATVLQQTNQQIVFKLK